MDEAFVIADIHGCLEPFEALLKHWNSDRQRLVILGDAIDRGPNSKEVVERILKEDALYLRGNHEDSFLLWLSEPSSRGYFQNYDNLHGNDTIKSFLNEEYLFENRQHLAKRFIEEYPDVYKMLLETPYYYEFGKYLLVHAGVDMRYSSWRRSKPQKFLWVRDEFLYYPNTTDKIVVFGHTPVFTMYGYKPGQVYVNSERDKVGIDGGYVFGHYMHAIIVQEELPLKVFTVNHHLVVEESEITNLNLDKRSILPGNDLNFKLDPIQPANGGYTSFFE